ncbi:insulin-like isoform X2 [Daktulosphaira vitifoliae]|uniref:insulin-like isoform X2 n=1 Tax=Daktulosphaira vitifoliae TaxID=58002 RepID=UPI0021AA8584|nr:insulin-like isoform X2 [Daktulosphaira vitifoliae]
MYKIMRIFWIISFLTLTSVFQFLVVNAMTQKFTTPIQYCGSKLADIARLVCRGHYTNKRSQIGLETWEFKEPEDYSEFPLRSKRDAMSFIPFSRSLRKVKEENIVGECCAKPCYISEIKSYCADPN